MAGENAPDEDIDPMALGEDVIDGAVDDLRGVLKKNAGGNPALNDESVDGMGGAAAFGSDFGADFADDEASGAVNDPFNIGDTPDLGTAEPGADDFDGSADFGAASATGGAFGGGDSLGQDFGAEPEPAAGAKLGASGSTSRVDLVLGIPIDVQIILGSSRMAVSSLMNLTEGATIALDRKIGEPVEIMVGGRLIGRGEITVLDSDDARFAVRIIEVFGAPQKKSD